jgi:hypothetical protein
MNPFISACALVDADTSWRWQKLKAISSFSPVSLYQLIRGPHVEAKRLQGNLLRWLPEIALLRGLSRTAEKLKKNT